MQPTRLFPLLLALLVVATPRTTEADPTPRDEKMIDERFAVQEGQLFDLDVADADVIIETGASTEAHIEVYLRARNYERAREYFEDLRFEVGKRGNTVYIKTDPERRMWSWNRSGGAQITIRAILPKTFDLRLTTSDGNIDLPAIQGLIDVRTSDGDVVAAALTGASVGIKSSDGDIRVGAIASETVVVQTSDGDINLQNVTATSIRIKTSDGTISAGDLDGEVVVHTSDGDISLRSVRGPVISLRTSDGDVTTEQLIGERIDVTSSDGELWLGDIGGNLRATTSGGDIRARLTMPAEIYLRTGDGDVHLYAPIDLRADLSFRGERVRIASAYQFAGTLEKDRARGSIGGGGPLIEVRASDGAVTFTDR